MDMPKKLSIVLCEWRAYQRFEEYSLGLYHLETALLNADYESHVLIYINEFLEKVCTEILSYKPQLVGFKLYKDTRESVFAMARILKAADPQIKIVLGGHLATLYGYLILTQEETIDIVIAGEGEATIVDLCRHLETGQDLADCQGIFYKKDDFVFKGASREAIRQLDTLVYPKPEKFKPRDSRAFVQVGLSTARGCMGSCCYCSSNHVFTAGNGERWRGLTPKKVGEEVKRLADYYSDHKVIINFVDSAFENPDPLTKARISEIMDQIEEQNTRIAFSIYTRAESWLPQDAPLIERMQRLGLYKLYLGFDESQHFKDPFELTENALAAPKKVAWELFRGQRLRICGFLILFHPFITLEQLKQSAVFLQEIEMAYHPETWTHSLELYPDTAMFNYVVDTGLLTGVEANKYAYRYGFYDGRVKKVHRLMNQVRELESYQAYRNTVSKIDYELDIYYALKGSGPLFGKVADEMNNYIDRIQAYYSDAGAKLTGLFKDGIENVEQGALESAERKVIDGYNQVFSNMQTVMEKEWLNYRLKIGRKKVRLA
jgi:anaerobic magnesium-protoporphyrin IX monomethyl ester cyclase